MGVAVDRASTSGSNPDNQGDNSTKGPSNNEGSSSGQQQERTFEGSPFPPPSDQDAQRGPAAGMNACLLVAVILYGITISLTIFLTPNPLFTLLFIVLAILPAALIAKAIRSHLNDDAIPAGFLKTQFFVAAIPLTMAVLVAELIATVLFALAILQNDIGEITKALESMDEASKDSDDLPEVLIKLVPLWKLVVFAIFMAFGVAAVIEEGAKWLLARRFAKVNKLPDNIAAGRQLTVRGILAIACTSALGLATAENLSYVLGLSRYSSKSIFPFRRIGLTVLRDVLAFPVHVGATLYIALAAAQRAVLGDGPSVIASFFVAVLFHGCFDAIALLAGLLIMVEILPKWTEFLIIVAQFVLVICLVVLVRSRFSSLLERERAVAAGGEIAMV